MDTLGSLITVVLVLAAIFVPQALIISLSGWNKVNEEEFITDGR